MAPPLILLCKYVASNAASSESVSFSLFPVSLDDLSKQRYITISHVWSRVEWSDIPGIPYQVPVSSRKSKFLLSTLRTIVGDEPFWMDVLCVEQKNRAARVAVTKYIPNIYRNGYKTIAIRDGDGLQECCFESVSSFSGWTSDPSEKLKLEAHIGAVHNNGLVESYLRRLWPLVEILESDCIQFVCCETYTPRRQYYNTTDAIHRSLIDAKWLTEALLALAGSWLTYHEDQNQQNIPDDDAVQKFITAFARSSLHWENTTVSRNSARSSPEAGIRTSLTEFNVFRSTHIHSSRVTTHARDFVLATFPRLSWYELPANAKDMTFAQLFVDAVSQSERSEVKICMPRWTKSMLGQSPKLSTAWQAALDIPEPETLGDFVKLFAFQTRQPPFEAIEATSVMPLPCSSRLTDTEDRVEALKLIEQSIRFSPVQWSRAFRHELLRYGIWSVVGREGPAKIQASQAVNQSSEQSHGSDAIYNNLGQLTNDTETKIDDFETDYYIPEAYATLALAVKAVYHPNEFGDRWERTKDWLTNQPWSETRCQKIVLMAALINCEIGLGAYKWAEARLKPVLVSIGGKSLLGLFNIHWRTLRSENIATRAIGNLWHMIGVNDMEITGKHWKTLHCAQRLGYLGSMSDLVLINEDASPIGLLPAYYVDGEEIRSPDQVQTERIAEKPSMGETLENFQGKHQSLFPLLQVTTDKNGKMEVGPDSNMVFIVKKGDGTVGRMKGGSHATKPPLYPFWEGLKASK